MAHEGVTRIDITRVTVAFGPTYVLTMPSAIARTVVAVVRIRAMSEIARLTVVVTNARLGYPPVVIAVVRVS